MKTAKIALLAGFSGSLLLASTAEAVITGVHVVPVSFEQGWLGGNGAPISSGTSTTAISQDAIQHGRTIAAWSGSNGQYKTFRLYLTVDNLSTPVNGISGDDVALIDFKVESVRKDLSGAGNGFFNYMTGTTLSGTSPGPQPFGAAANDGQGQRAYDSYLTVNSAQADGNAGGALEGVAGMFDAVRGRTGAAGTIQTGGTGNGFNAAASINCQNCGYIATLPITGEAYSYNSAASLAANAGLPITGQGVLVGQFTVNVLDGIQGQLLAVGTGTDETFVFDFAANIPAPGALALLGVAGMVGRKRRRS